MVLVGPVDMRHCGTHEKKCEGWWTTSGHMGLVFEWVDQMWW